MWLNKTCPPTVSTVFHLAAICLCQVDGLCTGQPDSALDGGLVSSMTEHAGLPIGSMQTTVEQAGSFGSKHNASGSC